MEDTDRRSSKRRRLDEPTTHQQKPISRPDQLYELLRFRQGITSETRLNINFFKDFLSGILKNDDLASQAHQLQVLRQYCNDQLAPSKEHIDFPDLLQTWSLAVESNNEAVCTAVPAALAQFFRTISGFLEFRDFGLSLCHSLLKRDQVRLFDRGLSAVKSKEHLISPCLRLLTEMVSFDGGAMATNVFARRDFLYKRLDAMLEQSSGDVQTDRRRATVRRMALRFVIANWKFLDAVAKADFITQLRVMQACLRNLGGDGDDIVIDVLQTINSSIVEDAGIPRASKARFFNLNTLQALSALYDYELDPDHPESDQNVRQAVQSLMLKVCATRKGILLLQEGWYPLGYDVSLDIASHTDTINLGLDSPLYFDDYSTTVPVTNTVLSAFVSSLSPEADVLKAQLLLQIFRTAPELVANFFTKKSKTPLSPGDDSTWRGHFAFLFSLVHLPVPKNLGLFDTTPTLPPPSSIVIESIIPRPLDKMILTKCFTSNDDILIMSGSRLISVALDKLKKILDIYARAITNTSIWKQAAARLVELVLQRTPQFKDITNTATRPCVNDAVKSSLYECVAAYYKVLPEATIGSKFDPGPILSTVLSTQLPAQSEIEATESLIIQISHLVTICRLAPGTKWFSKTGSDSLSLYTSLLKFQLATSTDQTDQQQNNPLSSIAEKAGVLNSTLSFAALQQSLNGSKKFSPSDELYLLIDNAIHRIAQKPVRYLDKTEAIQREVSDKKSLSLLTCSVAEQWEFALQKHAGQKEVLKNIADWIARYYNASEAIGENFRVMNQFQVEMKQAADEKTRGYLEKSFGKVQKSRVDIPPPVTEETEEHMTTKDTAKSQQLRTISLPEALGIPADLPTSLEGLDRWDSKTDLELALQSGRITKLIRCTASAEEEVRRQTFQILQNLIHLVDESAHSEKTQMYLLLSELYETIRHHGLVTPLPSVAAELAVKLLHILTNPAHNLFGKANRFVLRGPTWDLRKLIQHWTDKLLFHEPESDEPGAWTEEVEWYLQWLVDGLKINQDMELYRRSGVLEKILVLYAHPRLSRAARKMVLTVLWRAVCVGGADTIITRVGARSWLELAEMRDTEHAAIIKQLRVELEQGSDTEVIRRWEDTRPISRLVQT